MTPQEQEMIQGLIDRVQQTRLPDKDADAEHLLQQSLGRNPDALYILAQTVLVQKYALDQAQNQLSDLKSKLDHARQQQQEQPRHATSFLGSLLGHNDPPPPPPPPRPASSSQPYTPVSGYAPPPAGYAPAAPAGGQFGNPSSAAPQGGGFLRGAMQTAAGVAAGALAFQGVESLMHGFGGGGGGFGGGQGFGGFGAGAPREEIVNNYYGDSGSDRGGSGGLSNDIEDRRNDSSDSLENSGNSDDQFSGNADLSADTGSDYASNDDSSLDSGDDSSFDSGSDSSFDSGGDDSSFS